MNIVLKRFSCKTGSFIPKIRHGLLITMGLLALMWPASALAVLTIGTSPPPSCPSPTFVGEQYNGGNVCQFGVTSGGSPPYTWSISAGTVPPGMTFTTQFGYVGGIATTAGTYNFTVKAVDSAGSQGTLAVTIVVNTPPALSITTTSFSQGEGDTFYFAFPAATGGVPPYSWSLFNSPSGFNGLTLTTGGTFSGYPVAGGSFQVPVQVTDSTLPTPVSVTVNVPWSVFPAISISPASQLPLSPTVNTNTFGTFTFSASGGNGGPYSWQAGAAGDSAKTPAPVPTGQQPAGEKGVAGSLVRGAADVALTAALPSRSVSPLAVRKGRSLPGCNGVPDGMTLNATTGVLAGTPTVPCYYFFGVIASDGIGAANVFPTLIVADPVVITNTSIPPGQLNQPYDSLGAFSFTTTGGDDASTFAVTNLPPGITVNGNGLKGTPTVAGTYNLGITATDANTGQVGSRALPMVVFAPLSITTTSLPNASQNQAYSTTLAATGGSGVYTWAVAGNIPPGLTISAAGVLSGTPTSTGTFTPVTVTVTDATAGLSAQQSFQIQVLIGTTTTLGAGGTPTTYGSLVTLTGSVNPAASTGKITFYDNGLPIGTGILATGSASLSTRLLGTGTHKLTAYYQGNGTTSPSTSTTFTKVINTLPQTGFTSAVNYAVGSSPGFMAAGDFNNDGFIDLAVPNANSFTISILLGNALGTFTAGANVSTTGNPNAVVTGDFNGDGNVDIAVSNSGGTGVSVFPGRGDGTFGAAASKTVGTAPVGMVVADFNGDGIADLAVGNEASNSVSILLGAGDGTFPSITSTVTTGTNPTWVVSGDFNGDGKADIAFSNLSGNNVGVALGNGNGTFGSVSSYAAGASPKYLVALDLNGDGKIDLATANAGSASVSVLRGNGDGTFQTKADYSTGSGTSTVAAADVNNDGFIDLLTSNTSGSVTVLSGQANGTFVSATAATPGGTLFGGLVIADLNQDGRPDIAVVDASASQQVKVLLATLPQPTVNCPFAPPILTGLTYSTTCVGSSGIAPYSYSIATGTVPPGLSLNPATGVFSGTPNTAGAFSLSVQVTDSDTPAQSAIQTLTVNVYTQVSITTSSLPFGITGTAYTLTTLTATGGSGNYTWAATGLPAGLSLSPAGVLTGTPTTAGSTPNIQITATDATASTSFTRPLAIVVYNPLVITPGSLHNGAQNSVFSSVTLTATGGSGSNVWSAVGLPAGLSLSGAGVLSGTPTAPGVYGPLQFTVTDAPSGQAVSTNFNITIFNALTITTSALPNGVTNAAYTSTTMAASGGSGTVTWSATGLPAGLSLSAAGVLTGTPTAAGTSASVNITVSDSGALVSKTSTFSITVYPPVSVTTTSLPNGLTNSAYSFTMAATGGSNTTYTWTSSSLPTGLTLSSAGVLSGTPTVSGGFGVQISACDPVSGLCSAPNLVITIYAPVTVTTSLLPRGVTNQTYTATQLQASGGSGSYTWAATGLPAGMTLTAAGGLGGTPTAAGTSANVNITATDATAGLSGSHTFSITVYNPLLITTPSLPVGITGQLYSTSFSSSGGSGVANWSVTGLPPGITADSFGNLLGVPTTAGAYTNVNATLTDTAASLTDSRIFTVNVYDPLQITTASLPGGVTTQFYTTTLGTSGGSGTFTWSATGLPPGLTLNSSGVLSGTPTTTGVFSSVVITVNDAPAGQSAQQTFSVTVQNATTISLTTSGSPATFGAPVTLTATLTPSGTAGQVTFYDGENVLGTSTIATGTATLTTRLLPSGTRPLKAYYAGSTLALSSKSTALPQSVRVLPQFGFQPVNSFNATASSTPDAVATGDFNGDGFADLAVTDNDLTGGVTILLGAGDGTFSGNTRFASGGVRSRGIATGDFNADGKTDLVVTNNGSDTVGVLLGNGNGTFQAPIVLTTGSLPRGVVVVDMNRDGLPDIATANAGSNNVSVFLGKPAATFNPALNISAAGSPTFIVAADFNADGNADLASANADGTFNIILGNNTGSGSTVNNPAHSLAATGFSTGDVNGDGKPDLVFGDTGNAFWVYLGVGDGTFTAAVASSGIPVVTGPTAIGDFNGDAVQDLSVMSQGSASVLTALGNGTGVFQSPVQFSTAAAASALAVGDFNRDGRSDLAIPDVANTRVQILLGAIPQPTVSCTAPAPPILTGVTFSGSCVAISGVAPYTYSITAGALPTGVNLNSSTGALTGTPTAAGLFSFTISAIDTDTPPQSATQNYGITVYNPVSITTSTLPVGTTGATYSSTTLGASGGSGGYAWSATGLPAGLTLSAGGLLSGTPTAAGINNNVQITAFDATAGLSATRLFTIAVYNPLSITTSSLPVGVTSTVYPSTTLTKTGGSGTVTWAATGLPASLVLSAAGVLSGTPTAAGTSSNVQVTATDATAASSANATFTINVYNPLSITTTTLPVGVVGNAYTSTTLAATGGSGTVTWAATGLPNGLTLSAAGVLTGTPTVAGTSASVQATVTDATAGLNLSKTFTINIYDPLLITTSSLPVGITGTAYPSTTLTKTGGSGTVTWAATGLPAGLVLSAAGVLSGTPTAAGTSSNVQITATDTAAASSVSSTFTINVYNPLSITTTTLPVGVVGNAYTSTTLAATGGSGTVTWAATGLPNGLTLSAAGVLTGTPTVAGISASVQATVTDATAGLNLSKTFTINIYDPLLITTSSLPVGITGTAYPSTTLTKTGGSGTVTWAATGLPAGLVLSAAGVLSGTPTAAGTSSNVQITATDTAAASSVSSTFTINVYNPLSITTTTLPVGVVGNAYTSTTLAATGGSGTVTWAATGLPNGLTLSAAGVLTGTPTVAGISASLQATVTDAAAGLSLPKTFTITVYNPVTVTTSSLPFGILNQTYTSTTLAASGGSGTVTWAATGLPNGLTLSAAGVLTGTPTTAGTFAGVQVTAADSTAGVNGSQTYSITVYSSPVITTSALPNGVQSQTYSATALAATGGSSTYTWSATGLPAGITLSPAGLLSGTPTVSGTFSNVVVTVTDTVSAQTGSQTYTVIVAFTTTMTLQSSGTPSVFGAAVTLSANVVPASATGKVTFYDGATVLGTSTLTGGQATLTTTLLPSGTRSLSAYYLGSPLSLPSISAIRTQTVTALPGSGFSAPAGFLITDVGNTGQADAIADFNGDGKSDLVFVEIAQNDVGVMLGNGNGALLPVTYYPAGFLPRSVAVGDFDGDGRADFVISHQSNPLIQIFLGNGDGTFQSPLTFNAPGVPTVMAVSDFNRDGKADLAMANGIGGNVTIYLGNGDGTFQTSGVNYPLGPTQTPSGIVAVDLNGDRIADLAVSNQNDNNISILMGNGDGTFQGAVNYPAGVNTFSVVTADFNADGKPDLAAINVDTHDLSVLLGNGDGTFGSTVNYPLSVNGANSIATGDLNGDGRIDIAIADPNGTVNVLPGNGDGSFQAPVTYGSGLGPIWIAAGEFNGDGRTDLIFPTRTASTSVRIVLGQIPQPALTCNFGTVPVVTGTAYNFPCSAISGIAPYTYSISAGVLPTGLSINASTGAITGTPAATGTFNVTVRADDSDTPVQNATTAGSIFVATPLLAVSVMPGGVFGTPFSLPLASQGTPPYICSIATGTLPPGLALNGSTCLLSGTPTLGGVFNYSVSIADSGTPPQTNPRTYSQTITYPALNISAVTLPFGVQNQAYNPITFNAIGGSGTYSWSATGLPAGLTLSAGGILSGISTVSGTFASIAVTVTDSIAGANSSQTYSLLIYAPLSVTTTALPVGITTQTYPATTLAVSGGSGIHTWSATGLPAGLALSAAGSFSGTPTATGTFASVVVTVSDPTAGLSAQQTFTINVYNPVSITTSSLPLGTTTVAYPLTTLTATGGSSGFAWSATGLPGGLSLSAGGQLSGTPTAAGTFASVQVTLIDAAAGLNISRTYTINVFTPLLITTATLPTGITNQTYSATTLAKSGGSGTVVWTATGLPAGLTLSAAGLLSGTPTIQGVANSVQITATDATAGLSATSSFTIGIYNALTITTSTLPAGVQGAAYNQTSLAASGGSGTVTWSATGVPPGLTVSPAGLVSGTPTAAATYAAFVVTATDTIANQTAQQTYSVSIAYPPLLFTSNPNLGGVAVGGTLTFPLTATGGKPPYAWSVAGNVPAGVSVNASTGVITATPATFGTFTFDVRVTDAQPVSTLQTVTLTALAITSTATLPVGNTSAAYSFTFVAQGGATSTYNWTVVNGSLPAGLSLTTAGLLQGTPSQTGSFSFRVQASDNVSPATQNITITVFGPLTITTGSLPNGQQNQSYGPITMQATGGSNSYTWTATGLPPGFSLTSAGVLNGNPTVAGSYPSVVVTATDTSAQQSVSKTYTITIASPVAPLQISGSGDLGGVAAGSPISGSFTASGGTPPYTWSGSGMPAGISVNSGSGAVSGATSAPGNFSFVLQVADSTGATSSLTVSFNVLALTSGGLPSATVGQNYSQSITAAGGTPPYSFSSTAGLPPGIAVTGSGAVTGKPTAAGNFVIAARVTDSRGVIASANVAITVLAPGAVLVSTTSLADTSVSQPYSQTLSAVGGLGSYTWTQTGGSLPDGLSLSATGTISGTPKTAGTFTVSVQVVDTSGASSISTVTLTVKPPPLLLGGSFPSGIVNVDYPAQILSPSGGIGPYTYVLKGSLPDGLTLSNGSIGGTPTASGIFGFSIVVTDSNAATATLDGSITIRTARADLVLSSSSVSFSISTGANGLPAPNALTIRSSDVAQILNYSMAFTAAPWLTVITGASTPNDVTISLSSQALALTAAGSPYTSTITVTCVAPSPCAGNAQTVGVSLVVSSPPPQLTLSTSLLSFTASSVTPAPSTQTLGIQNTGGGTLGIASVTATDNWISIGSFPAAITSGPPVAVSITANPAGLTPGYYRGNVNITSSAGSSSVAVTLLVAADASMTLGPAGTQFSMPAGGVLGNSSGAFLVSVTGNTPVDWSASVQPGAGWLVANTTSGSSSGQAPGNVSFSIDAAAAAALAVGPYYGTIRVSAPGIVNAPQDFQVVLNITPAASPALPDPQPAGLVFLTSGSTPLPPQIVQVFASSKTALPYQASAATSSGGNWLQVSPATGTTQAGAPGQSSLTISAAGLAPGVYRGGVSYAFSASAVRTVNVTLIVQPALPAITPRGISASGCSPAQLVPTQTGLVSNFSAPASWPTPLAIRLVDDCGTAIAGGQIVATFSNGDPPQILSLIDGGAGLYSATWTPRKTSSQVTIAAKATAPGFPAATAQIIGQVTPNVAPALTPHGTLHIFNPQVGAALGPGNIVQIYGTGLASSTAAPTTIPLPTTLGGTSVIIGGKEAPLFFVSGGQVNAQVPFELEPGRQYQVIVQANGALTTPDTIQVSPVAPGIAAFGTGEIIAQHQDGSIITDASPAKPGEYIVFYMSGLGVTDNPVTTGAASPGDNLARPQSVPALTLAGQPVDILFAGLTPGLVGLYQVNVQIPADAKDGLLQLVISQAGTPSNSTILPVKK